MSNASFRLPNMEKSTTASEFTPSPLGFPSEFPYEFDSPAFSPGFTSPGDSTETEDESSDDEEDFLAGLTRRLAPSTQRLHLPPSLNAKTEEKRQGAATSPQSTLSGLGSYSNSGSRSPVLPPPPATSFKRDNAWDVISAAAGEVARLKLGSYEPRHSPNPSPILRRQNAAFQVHQQRILDQMWLSSHPRIISEGVAFENMRYNNASSNSSWIPHHTGTPLKRPSVGTGVFLPRRYPTESVKKPVPVNTAPMLQSKVEPQILNPRLSQLELECMLARSRLVAARLRSVAVGGGCCMNQERRLPQDWMY